MRVYVAGRFSHYARCREMMDDLAAAGHVITHDWTRTEEFGADGRPNFADGGKESAIPKERCSRHARNDIRAASTADLVVVLADDVLTGALIEVGAALVSGVRVWICAPYRWTIFWEHPLVEVLPSADAARARLIAARKPA